MLEAIREGVQGWLAKVILAIIIIPFALFGIDAYLKDAGSNAPLVKLDGDTISMQEFSNAMQTMRNRLQAQGQKDLTVLDTAEAKQSVLDKLISARLMTSEAKKDNFRISDEQLSQYVVTLPEFQDQGKFSQEKYTQVLQQNGLSSARFENSVRTDLLTQQSRDGLAGLAYMPASLEETLLKRMVEKREISVAEYKAADFSAQVTVPAEKIQSYYDVNKSKFRVPEQVRLEFILLSANALLLQMQATDEEAKKYYEENISKFQGDEQRRASHILIGFGVSANVAAKAEAKKKAEQVLAEVNKNPEKFSELAKKYSTDSGSAEKGGDLGSFGRGAMVKPFEDAVFGMTPGAVSGLVESDYGYHIIKLTEVTGGTPTFESQKAQIRGELMYQKALAKFSENAEAFSNAVYEQSDSLKPAAEKFGLQIQTSPWMSRADAAKFFKNDKFADAVFSSDVIRDKRNSEAVEIGNNTLAAARVIEHKPAAPRSFDEVKAAIEEVLKLEQAAKLATSQGQRVLASLKAGKEEGVQWQPPVMLDRKNPQGLSEALLSTSYQLDASQLPAFGGVADQKGNFYVIRLNKVDDKLVKDDPSYANASINLQTALAEEYLSSYARMLKTKSKITINQQLLGAGSN